MTILSCIPNEGHMVKLGEFQDPCEVSAFSLDEMPRTQGGNKGKISEHSVTSDAK